MQEVHDTLTDYSEHSDRSIEHDMAILTYAAFFGQVEFARRLMEKKDISTVRICGRSPLIWSVWNKHIEIARFLIENGAAVDARDNISRTVLM